MLEIIAWILIGGALLETARRRGSRIPSIYPIVALIGGCALLFFGAVRWGEGPGYLLAASWGAVVYLSLFVLVGGARRAKSTWQCPNCEFFNDPTTLVCPCGERLPEEASGISTA